MKTRLWIIPLLLLVLVLLSCREDEGPREAEQSTQLNTITDAESAEGWILLFDGETFNGWRGLGRDGIPEGHWVIEDGNIKKIPSGDVPVQADGQPLEGGDLMTEGTFGDFELYFEWKICHAGNSGIKYNVSEEMSTSHPPRYAALGFEYQILDDDGHPDAQVGNNRTASALYDLIGPAGKSLKMVGGYNSARIVFRGNHGEHCLNGVKVLEYELGSTRFRQRLAASKYRDIAGFAERRNGHIVLQDHGDAVWYRNIKIKEIKPQ